MRKILNLFATILIVSTTLGFIPNKVSAKVLIGDDYPQEYKNVAKDYMTDSWNFFNRECTSYVAWRMNRDHGITDTWFKNVMRGPNGNMGLFGNAGTWMSNAINIGFTVDNNPRVGDVAYFAPNSYEASSLGHVAYVESVNSNNTVNVSEYNFYNDGNYTVRNNINASAFIHINTFKSKYTPGDVDGDGRKDFTLFRPTSGDDWYTKYVNFISSNAAQNSYTDPNESANLVMTSVDSGTSSDILVPGDYDGDKKMDPGIYIPASTGGTGTWSIKLTSGAPIKTVYLGAPGDIPIVGDFDGDGKVDPTVWNRSSGNWTTYFSSGRQAYIHQHGGYAEDIPLTGDYDGDGKSDLVIFRPSTSGWYIFNPVNNTMTTIYHGGNGDLPIPEDYDGDGKTDVSIYRPSEGKWYIKKSSDGTMKTIQHGNSTDIPVPGDYDGDGKADPGLYRPSEGTWYVMLTGESPMLVIQHGHSTDKVI